MNDLPVALPALPLLASVPALSAANTVPAGPAAGDATASAPASFAAMLAADGGGGITAVPQRSSRAASPVAPATAAAPGSATHPEPAGLQDEAPADSGLLAWLQNLMSLVAPASAEARPAVAADASAEDSSSPATAPSPLDAAAVLPLSVLPLAPPVAAAAAAGDTSEASVASDTPASPNPVLLRLSMPEGAESPPPVNSTGTDAVPAGFEKSLDDAPSHAPDLVSDDQPLSAAITAAVHEAMAKLGGADTAATSVPPSPAVAESSPAPSPVAAPAAVQSPQPLPSATGSAPDASAQTLRNALMTAPLNLQDPDSLPARLADRVQWLIGAESQEVRLQLHPREFGSINVQMKVEGQGVSVWFAAEHPGARAALESALPQLRERLAGENLQLAQTQVASQTASWNFPDAGGGNAASPFSAAHQQHQQARGQAGGSGQGHQPASNSGRSREGLPEARATPAIVHIGLLDQYA